MPFIRQNLDVPLPLVSGGVTFDGRSINYASGVVFGPFYIGNFPSLQFLFTPTNLDSKITITWYQDQALTRSLGSLNWVVGGIKVTEGANTPQTLAYNWPNCGPWFTIRIDTAGAVADSGNLFLSGSNQPGKANLNNTLNNLFGSSSFAVNPNTTKAFRCFFAYAGAVNVAAQSDISNCTMGLNYYDQDINLLGQIVAFNLTRLQTVTRDVLFPQRIVRVFLTNHSPTQTAHFTTSLLTEVVTG